MARTRLYRDGELVLEGFPVNDISEYLKDEQACVWLDYCAPTTEDLASIAEELQLHPLAVEDAVSEHQRPKLDRYDSHLFLSAYAVKLDTESGQLSASEIGVFITTNALVTVRQDEGVSIDLALARWDESKELSQHGVSFLLWGLLDAIVDGHFEAVQSLDTEIETLEDLLFDDAPHNTEVQRRSFELRKSLVLLRRLVLPMREVVNSLMRRDLHVLDQQMAPYYQDVYDHVLRATEWTESLRDLVTTILETNLTIQGNRMNLVMKKVTSWAAIIAVPTAITGFYGQNVPYPGFAAHWGFWFSTVLIILLSGSLYWAFRRNDWI
jgi:magnesium transporter